MNGSDSQNPESARRGSQLQAGEALESAGHVDTAYAMRGRFR